MLGNNELLQVSLWLALAGYGAPAGAQAETQVDAQVGAQTRTQAGNRAAGQASITSWAPVNEAHLERTRGGFSTPSGLEMKLGIERLVSINGNIVARTSFDISDLNRLSEASMRQTSNALSSVNLIQNGGDNIYQPGDAARTVGAVVIQNTLNDQLIRSQTLINSTVNSAGLLKTLNFQSSLSDALTRAAGAR